MSLYFFDSSALAKRYMPETGSHWVLSLAAPTQRNRIFVADEVIRVLEGRAASPPDRQGPP